MGKDSAVQCEDTGVHSSCSSGRIHDNFSPQRAAKEDEEIKKVLRDLVNGQPESSMKRAKDQILYKVTSIVTSPTSWPKRTCHTIMQIFTSKELRIFTKIAEAYLNKKASE